MLAARQALKKFNIKGAIESVALFGDGHINDTYKVITDHQQYLLQKVNTAVFQEPDILENNLEQLFQTGSDILVQHKKTIHGHWLLRNDSGVWKVQVYDGHAYAPQKADSSEQISQIAKGFGQFTKLGLGLPADSFAEAIPDFHNLTWRLEQLDKAIAENRAGRKNEAAQLIEKAADYRYLSEKMDSFLRQGLPLRLCHNDTKIDNILLSRSSDEFKYVIDLDTVGPGYLLYDFGDMMRTMLSPTKESEPDISKIALSQKSYDVLREAYLVQCSKGITALEIESLSFGGMYMTYLMAIRFLADYLNGDIYYKVSHAQENFIRARNQLRILQLMQELRN